MELAVQKMKPPPAGARCDRCGSAEVSNLPTFAVGCGQAYRNIADDVFCRRCGHIGPPNYAGNSKTKSE